MDRPAPQPRVWLGSASPRRAELLRAAGIAFEVDPPDVDESVAADLAPEAAALVLAERKARAVAARHAGLAGFVIAADTIVAIGAGPTWRLLGKPDDAPAARRMLEQLSGTRHQVVTGVAVADTRSGRVRAAFERTWVTMRPILPAEVAAYVASGEWRDKAGGYAIQESADRFVTVLEGGGFDNVVGLPVARTLELLAAARTLAREGGDR